jgi:tRNA modification GTPase
VSDTIFALSSGALPAAISIVRISGPGALAAVERLAGPLPPPRTLALRALRDADGELVDRAMVACFPAPKTVTGEPLAELHCHGSRAVVARLLGLLGAMPGLRLAEPGEFTRRALFNGRLDLTEAEGLADLLAAETEWQLRAASLAAGGGLRSRIEGWRNRLLLLSAEAEAAIDYVDEEETGQDVRAMAESARRLGGEWEEVLRQPPAELLQQGLRVVLAGPPNAGKSSLFNALLNSEKAIVTPVAGTTRDLIEAAVDLEGMKLVLVDTAGVRETGDEVERIGVERAEAAALGADLLLWLGRPEDCPPHAAAMLVHSRADERGGETIPKGAIATSVRTGGGLKELRQAIVHRARRLLPPPDRISLNRRQSILLSEARDALGLVRSDDLLLTAEALRQALAALDRLSGRQSTEDVLDAVFTRFCLGK